MGKERENFVAAMAREGVPVDVARKVMRAATTLHRLAEATCNGDWPANNGTSRAPGGRKVEECAWCQQLWVPSFFVQATRAELRRVLPQIQGQYLRICRECRTMNRLESILKPYNITIDQADLYIRLKTPSGERLDP